jgi:6-phosphogluconate dehydrogenase
LGAAAPLITEAVFSRSLSAMAQQRQLMAKAFESDMVPDLGAPNEAAVQDIEDALYCAKLISYSQGFSLLKMASDAYAWRINCADVARNWRGGCIIRSALLNPIREAYERDAALSDLMIDGFFVDQLKAKSPAWRRVVSDAVAALIPVPALSSGLNYFHALRRNRLPANLIQAQRDYFGAHTYERVDRPKGEAFHSAWGEPDPDPD